MVMNIHCVIVLFTITKDHRQLADVFYLDLILTANLGLILLANLVRFSIPKCQTLLPKVLRLIYG